MRYRELHPGSLLEQWIDCLWFLEDSGELAGSSERILPDGSFEIVFHLGDAYRQGGKEGFTKQAASILVAVLEEPVWITPTGSSEVIGIRFRPGGLYPFIDARLSEIAGSVWSLDHFMPELAALRGRLGEERDTLARARLITATLLERLARLDRIDHRVDACLTNLRDSRGFASIGELARLTGISRRQFERRFASIIGVTPKRLSRVLRFHEAVRAILGGSPLSQIPGYSDQAHFTNDFRSFSGTTPSAFLNEPRALNEQFHHA